MTLAAPYRGCKATHPLGLPYTELGRHTFSIYSGTLDLSNMVY